MMALLAFVPLRVGIAVGAAMARPPISKSTLLPNSTSCASRAQRVVTPRPTSSRIDQRARTIPAIRPGASITATHSGA